MSKKVLLYYRITSATLILILTAALYGGCASKNGNGATAGTTTKAVSTGTAAKTSVSAVKTAGSSVTGTGTKTTAQAGMEIALQTNEKDQSATEAGEETEGQTGDEGESTAEVEESIIDELKYDFQGKTIYLANFAASMPKITTDYDSAIAKQYSADGTYVKGISKVDDARYEHWRNVEEIMNCKIRVVWQPLGGATFYAKAATEILAGTFEYPISYFLGTLAQCVKNNLIYSLNDLVDVASIPKLNLGNNTVIEYKGKTYSINEVQITRLAIAINYNPEIAAREGIPDLFNLYQNGQWTWEKFIEAGQQATKDFDSDGIIDQWGFVVSNAGNAATYFTRTNGTPLVEYRNDTGKFVLNLNNPAIRRTIGLLSDVYNVYKIGKINGTLSDFMYGRAFMLGDGDPNYYSYYIYSKSGLKCRYVPHPLGPDAIDGKYVGVLSSTSYYVPICASEPESAAALLINLLQPQGDPDKYKADYNEQLAFEKNYLEAQFWPGISNDWADILDFWVNETRGYNCTIISDKKECSSAFGTGAGTIPSYFSTEVKNMILTNANIVTSVDAITPILENLLNEYN